MKKVVGMLLIAMAVLTGCGSENTLADQLEDIDQIEYVSFYQTMLIGSRCYPEDGIEDIENMLDIFDDVSSDKELFEEHLEEYLEDGLDRLYSPVINIHYLSGDTAQIHWETGTGVLTYNDVEYYIDMEHALMLYDIFTKYSPNAGTNKFI